MDLCLQRDVSAFLGTVQVLSLLFFQGASIYFFAPFNFMAAVTIYSDFGAQENKICHEFLFFFFHLFAMK